MAEGNLLIIDDNKSVLSALSIFLDDEFDIVSTISNPNRIHNELLKQDYDVVLLDMNFKKGENTGNEGIYWLREIKKMIPETEVVMFTAYGDVELAVKALKTGAADFILKPWDNEKLLATLKSALKLRKSGLEIKKLKSNEKALKTEINHNKKRIVGSSSAIMQMMEMIEKVAQTDANILITGENGTGKELIANEIHRLSSRHKELLVNVDMGAITETLFESELFGHKKGAFTDAYEDRPGKFVVANKGSLFLDEIGNLPLHLQSKLLSVLQTRKVRPVGSSIETAVDIRLICATNCNLNQMVADNTFREDLLYRINTIQIEAPPLRNRKGDVKLLTEYFVEQYKRKYNKNELDIDTRVFEKLEKYPWPGNVRELQHTIEKAVILSNNISLTPDDFFFNQSQTINNEQPETIEEMEKRMILSALKNNDSNMSAAANQLGVTRQTLYNKMKKYGF